MYMLVLYIYDRTNDYIGRLLCLYFRVVSHSTVFYETHTAVLVGIIIFVRTQSSCLFCINFQFFRFNCLWPVSHSWDIQRSYRCQKPDAWRRCARIGRLADVCIFGCCEGRKRYRGEVRRRVDCVHGASPHHALPSEVSPSSKRTKWGILRYVKYNTSR